MANPRKHNKEKIKRAESHPSRPGEECKAAPGVFRPEINRARCEGKADCTEVCPYDVFEVGTIAAEDFAKLSVLGKLKSMAHKRQTAYTPRADLCQACGLCVVACPEKAIALIPVSR
jgi:NAD-dependent dihydropyrimidine dehydrogenase PreA subunit